MVYAGNVTLGKGVPYLLEAWRRLPAADHARLDIYGRIGLPADLLAPAGETVRFHGPRPRADLFQAFEQADVLVFPSLADGFGMVVAESMASGTPALVSTQTGAKAIIEKHPGSGWVVEPTAEALYAQVRALALSVPEMRAARAAALRAAQDFTWQSYRQRVRDVFTERVLT